MVQKYQVRKKETRQHIQMKVDTNSSDIVTGLVIRATTQKQAVLMNEIAAEYDDAKTRWMETGELEMVLHPDLLWALVEYGYGVA